MGKDAGQLDRRALRSLAGHRSFERGETYFASKRVQALAESDGTIAAKVVGTRPYRVKLQLGNGKILCDCNCPMGQDGIFCKHGVAAKTYATILGKQGLGEYRKLAEAEWAKVPTLEPGARDGERYRGRYGITRIMESLAKVSGDAESLVAVQKRDLSSAWSYLKIAQAYKEAGRHDDALAWAERGIKAFPKHADYGLLEFLANEYHRRKRHDEAMAIVWAHFTESPTLEPYRNLKDHAGRTGGWKEWRSKALDLVRERIAKSKKGGSSRWGWPRPEDHSELVRIFLWEKAVEAAWKEAKEGGCSAALWRELAGKREKSHPADALPVYQRLIEPTLGRTNNEAYREALGLLRKIRELMERVRKKGEFKRFLAGVRAAHKQRRNFIKLIDGAKWG